MEEHDGPDAGRHRCTSRYAAKTRSVAVSSAFRNAILRRGLPNGLIELGDFARRYLFLGDERMLLAELQRRPRCADVISEELPGHFWNCTRVASGRLRVHTN